MNWAALLSFIHPMAVVLICGFWILHIISKEYKQKIDEQTEVKK